MPKERRASLQQQRGTIDSADFIHTTPSQGGVFYCLSRAGNTLCSHIEQIVTTEMQMALLVLTELLTAIRAKDSQGFRE